MWTGGGGSNVFEQPQRTWRNIKAKDMSLQTFLSLKIVTADSICYLKYGELFDNLL